MRGTILHHIFQDKYYGNKILKIFHLTYIFLCFYAGEQVSIDLSENKTCAFQILKIFLKKLTSLLL